MKMAAKRAKPRVPIRLDWRTRSEAGSAKAEGSFHVSKSFTADTKVELDEKVKAHLVQIKEDVARNTAENLGKTSTV